jgi:hypothetical protein
MQYDYVPIRVFEDENSELDFPRFIVAPTEPLLCEGFCICGINDKWKKIILLALDALTRWDSFSDRGRVAEIENLIIEIIES